MALNEALSLFAERTGLQLVYVSALAEGVQTQGAQANLAPDVALQELLKGTGLSYRFLNAKTVTIATPEALEASALPRSEPSPNVETAPIGEVVGADSLEMQESATASVENVRRGGIEEIIVTARKREESVQDVPISITALSSEDMKSFGIRNVADMEGIVPGLNMGGGGNGVKKDSNPFIRGVGQRETKVTLDPAVGTYIDGIYIARPAGGLIDVASVESIQVLRGPQGTLFGRNTTGGAIAITTRKPQNAWGAEVSSNVGNYGRSDVTLSVNAPIIADTLLSRLTVSSVNSDGYFTNVVDNSIWGGDNRITGIGQLRWLPTDDLSFDVLGERTRVRETPRPTKCAVGRPIEVGVFRPIPINTGDTVRTNNGNPNGNMTFAQLCEASENLPNNEFASDFAVGGDLVGKGRYWVDTSTLGLTATWDVGDLGWLSNLQAKSISAWRRVDAIGDEDLDSIPAAYLLRYQPDFTKTTQLTQELQLIGSAMNERLHFSSGVYYFQEETPKDDLYRAVSLVQGNPALSGANVGRMNVNATEPTWERLSTDNESYAWFGQVDFDITPQLQATAGLRFTHERRWSEYSKAYVLYTSLVEGAAPASLDFYAPYGCMWSCSTSTMTRGLNRMQDWEFSEFGYDSLSTTDKAWTPMFSIKYQLDGAQLDRLGLDGAMIYATYSEGFHSGGVTAGAIDSDGTPGFGGVGELVVIDGRTVAVRTASGQGVDDPITFDPEYVKNYEVGLKMQAFDRRMQANLAVFYMDYTDMQITSTANRAGVPIPQVENVGKSVIQGVEAEFIFLPTPEWRVVLSGAYTDADMKEWDARKLILNTFTGAVQSVESERRDDEPMPRVPEWQGFLMTDYTFMLPGGGTLAPSISARYSSEIYHGFDRGSFLYGRDVVTSEKVTFIDARIPWVSADGKMEVAAWVKNLTNIDDYLVGGIPLVDVTGAMGQVYANPRTFGLNMTYHFGAL